MANVYVRSGAGGAGTGADWANAYTTLAAAAAAKAAGDTFFVSEDHAESQASAITIAMPGTVSSPNRILCVDHNGSVPPVSADLRTTATISTTGANAITVNGFAYCYGVTFSPNSGAAGGGGSFNCAGTVGNQQRYDNCNFNMLSIAAGANWTMGNSQVYLKRCTMQFGNVGDFISVSRSRFEWVDSPNAINSAGSASTVLFNFAGGTPAHISLEGVDLSFLSTKTIFPAFGLAVDATMKDCKLPASVTICAAQTGGIGAGNVKMINCDSANNYRLEKHNYAGDQTTETTIIRTGGASDGTQGVAFKVVTTANSRWEDPFTCIPIISKWNDTVGSPVSVTVYGIWGGGAVPNKEDVWIDVEYHGTSGNPQGTLATSGNADILATAACDSDASSWGGSTTAFKMVATFTPQQKGPFTVYVRCAKASSTFYIDPKAVIS